MPAESVALYGRWWQLETWLRSLVYVEFRARFGKGWSDELPVMAERRERDERLHPYMLTPDAQQRLAYLDAGSLFDTIDDHWELFDGQLLEQNVWRGRVHELRKLRNRIGHCRRAHNDDLARIEQTLRDLEPGALRAVTAFNRTEVPTRELEDPLVAAWLRKDHEDARRLVDHARSQYEVLFRLEWSRRPWAPERAEDEPISGLPGYVWHAVWIIREQYLNLQSLWRDYYLDPFRDTLIFVCAPSPLKVEMSFPAVDDSGTIADAIGDCFDAVLESSDRVPPSDRLWEKWASINDGLDPRVQVQTPWSLIDDTTSPVSLFDA